MSEQLSHFVDEHLAVAQQVRDRMLPAIAHVGRVICAALAGGGRLLLFGNGGSAADAQHFAAELVGRYRRERRPLPAVALTTDSSALTCIGNDYDFSAVFARQVAALGGPGDVVVGITTSGNSENVVRGLAAAREQGAVTVALTGEGGGRAAAAADHALVVPSAVTARIQEMHTLIIHLLCEQIDDWAGGLEAPGSARG
ncbi:MAG: phosphoheptose isomerase [Firmicutes bacterium]|nr:phosphoheptose isomerase [Bacillota bacterium]